MPLQLHGLVTETDWLHHLVLDGVSAGFHLVVRLVADSPRIWFDYSLLIVWSTKFMWMQSRVPLVAWLSLITYNLQPIVRTIFDQSQYAFANEDRSNWTCFDHFSLIAQFQNRAIRCTVTGACNYWRSRNKNKNDNRFEDILVLIGILCTCTIAHWRMRAYKAGQIPCSETQDI
jgi:hypothetical protein